MASSPIELSLLDALESEAGGHGIDIVDVEVQGAGRSQVVRVRIDHADEVRDTITLEEIADETAWISALLDDMDPIADSYTLEVSSPGLERPLRRARDFERFAGERVTLMTNASEGRRKYTGELLGMREGCVAVLADDGEHRFALEELRSCKIKPDYDALAKPKASTQEG